MNIPQSVATGLGNEPAAPCTPARVLVIDDETTVCGAVSAMLKADGYEVLTVQSGEEAVERLRGQRFELAITDIVMSEMDGMQTIAALKELDPDIEVIVLTGHAGVESAVAALKHGACDYLLKPINMSQLCAAVTRAIERRRLHASLSLYDATPTLLAALEHHEVIPALLELVQGSMRATAAGLALVPPEGTGLHVEVSGSDGRLKEAAVKRLARQAMQARGALRDPSFETGHPHRGEAGIPAGSILAFPLEVRGAFLGGLVLWREKAVMPFTVFEQRSGEILAAEIAIALDDAHLCRELSRKTEELETAHSAVARAEANARVIINAAQEAIILFDKEGVVWDLNPKALEIFGRSRDETVGHNLVDFAIPPRELGHFREYVETVYRVGRHPADKVMEVAALRKNGEEFPLEILSTLIETPQGKLLSTFGRDITERKRAEKALRESEERYRLLFENNLAGVYRTTQDGHFLDCNPALARMFGFDSPQEVLGHRVADFYHSEDDRADFLENLKLRGGLSNFELQLRRKDGSPLWVLASVNWWPQACRPCQIIEGTLVDITERKRAERRLRESEAKYRTLLENLPQKVFHKDENSVYVACNENYARDLGIEAQEITGKTDYDFYPKELAEKYRADDARIQRSGYIEELDESYIQEGEPRMVHTVKVPLRDDRDAPSGILGIFWDITEKRRAEEALRESEEKYRALVETTGTGYVIIDTEGTVIDANPEYVRLAGRGALHEVLGRKVAEWTSPHDLARNVEAVRRCAELGFVRNYEVEHVTGDGQCTPIEINATVVPAVGGVRMVALCRDITDRKRAEQALRQSEERYRLLFERNLAGAFRGTLLSRQILDCNDAYARILGFDSRQDVLDCGRLHDFCECADLEALRSRLLKEKVLTNFEALVCRKNKTPVWVLENVSLIEAGEGKEPLIEGTLIDITKRKHAEQALAQERDLLRALMDNLPDGIYFKDRESRFTRINQGLAKDFGLSNPAQAIGKGDFDFFTAEQAQPAYDDEQEVIRTGKPMMAKEEKRTWPDGRVTWVSTTKMPLQDAAGAIIGTFGISRDITERKRVEEALRESEARYRRLFERNLAGVFQGTLDGHVLDCNDAYARILGYNSRQEILRLEKLDYFYDAEEGMAAANLLQKEGSHTNFEIRLKRRDGSPVSVLSSVTLTDMGEGRPPLVEGTLIDISERKRAARALEERTTYLDTLIEISPLSIVVLDTESCVQMSNPAFEKLFLYSRQELQGVNLDELIIPSELASEARGFNEQCLRGASVHAISRRRRKDGTLVDVEIYGVPLVMEGQPRGTLALYQDITERKRAEEALRASEERYRELFENASDLVFTTDLEAARFTSLNRVAEQTIGYSREEAAQMNLRQLVDPRYWQRLEQTPARLLAGDSAVTLELGVMAKDGRRVMLEVKPRLIYKEGKPIGMQGIGRDITGREAAEMELRHAQKLESVGRLASGIAHEINTPIQFVGDNTRFLQDSFAGLQTLLNKYRQLHHAAASGSVSPDLLAAVGRAEEESDCAYLLEEIPKALTQTLDGVNRVATIVRAMKDFAHPESKEKAAADLNKALLSTLTVARNELKYVADVETDFGDLPPVVCNISDLNQVFLNLLVNAAHAISEVVKGTGTKGKIRVRTVAEGKTVLITITDTGCGIPEGVRSRVFDPFFTTKEVGRGTGQGLAIARSVVVERHKGSLSFESEVGKGTTFHVRLPVDSGECSEETRVP